MFEKNESDLKLSQKKEYVYTTDGNLCADIILGNELAKEYLYYTYTVQLRTFIRNRLMRWGESRKYNYIANDIENCIWENIFNLILGGKFDDGIGHLPQYIWGIFNNSFKDCFNTFEIITAEKVEKIRRELYDSEDDKPENSDEHIELKDILLNKIKPKYSKVIYLRIFKELRYSEIAKKLNLNESTVRWRYSHGLEQLRKFLFKNKSWNYLWKKKNI